MIHQIPDNWKYSDEMEMTWYFYQISDELLSENTQDTFALPLHNSISLIFEIQNTYKLLEGHNIINQYYKSYIPVVIDELLLAIQNDYVVKRILGKRLSSIVTGFTEAKSNHVLLERWINTFKHYVQISDYLDLIKSEISALVRSTKGKQNLAFCIKSFYITMVYLGYSREFLYLSVKRFFNNKRNIIDASKKIDEFLSLFTCQEHEMEFIMLMDIKDMEYIGQISNQGSPVLSRIEILNETDKKNYSSDSAVSALLDDYNKKRYGKKGQKLEVIKYKANGLDEYQAIERFREHILFLQSLSQYFKHYYPSKQIFKILYKTENGLFVDTNFPKTLRKRPYISQELMDSRINTIIDNNVLSYSTYISLIQAIQMHSEALESRNVKMILKNFWTSLETIFASQVSSEKFESVIDSTLHIIQKTYLLKILRYLYVQINESIDDKDCLESLSIMSFSDFVYYFSKYEESSDEMKQLYSLLSYNPLLRSRLFDIRKKLSSGKSISEFLAAHRKRIQWQLMRIYRFRNIATHLGNDIFGINIVVNHVHDYFDFIVNYILCKSENDDYISSVSTLAFEAQNDNQIHHELLKSNERLSESNYMEYLFGPDKKLIKYEFY